MPSSLATLACRLAAIRIDARQWQRMQQAEVVRDYDYTVEEANGTEVIHHVVQGAGGKWVANEVVGTIGGTGKSAWEGVTHVSAKASGRQGGLSGKKSTEAESEKVTEEARKIAAQNVAAQQLRDDLAARASEQEHRAITEAEHTYQHLMELEHGGKYISNDPMTASLVSSGKLQDDELRTALQRDVANTLVRISPYTGERELPKMAAVDKLVDAYAQRIGHQRAILETLGKPYRDLQPQEIMPLVHAEILKAFPIREVPAIPQPVKSDTAKPSPKAQEDKAKDSQDIMDRLYAGKYVVIQGNNPAELTHDALLMVHASRNEDGTYHLTSSNAVSLISSKNGKPDQESMSHPLETLRSTFGDFHVIGEFGAESPARAFVRNMPTVYEHYLDGLSRSIEQYRDTLARTPPKTYTHTNAEKKSRENREATCTDSSFV